MSKPLKYKFSVEKFVLFQLFFTETDLSFLTNLASKNQQK